MSVNVQSSNIQKLEEIVCFFKKLSYEDKLNNLIDYSRKITLFKPTPYEKFDIKDVKQDLECNDLIIIFIKFYDKHNVLLKVSIGKHVKIINKALIYIFCESINNNYSPVNIFSILNIDNKYINYILGEEIIKTNNFIYYHFLSRLKNIFRLYLTKPNSSFYINKK